MCNVFSLKRSNFVTLQSNYNQLPTTAPKVSYEALSNIDGKTSRCKNMKNCLHCEAITTTESISKCGNETHFT